VLKGSTSLYVPTVKDFATLSNSRYLVVGDELVYYQGYSSSSKVFQRVERGLYGTGARSHMIGTRVAQARRLVGEVESVVGNTVTLSEPAGLTVSGAPVTIGSFNLKLRGLTFDGSQISPGSWSNSSLLLSYELSRFVTIADSRVTNADRGAISFDSGTRDSLVERNVFEANGDTSTPASQVWLYRGASRNVIRDNVMSGPSRYGVIIDDRTALATEFDSPGVDNQIIGNQMSAPRNATTFSHGVAIYGGANNIVSNNVMSDGDMGVFLGWYQQGTDPVNADSNTFTGNTFLDLGQGVRTNGTRNLLTDNRFERVDLPCVDLTSPGPMGNTFERNTVEPSGSCPG
jgi:hypothetical protein